MYTGGTGKFKFIAPYEHPKGYSFERGQVINVFGKSTSGHARYSAADGTKMGILNAILVKEEDSLPSLEEAYIILRQSSWAQANPEVAAERIPGIFDTAMDPAEDELVNGESGGVNAGGLPEPPDPTQAGLLFGLPKNTVIIGGVVAGLAIAGFIYYKMKS